MELIRHFSKLGRNDANIAGGKGASLGEMTQAGLAVPPGFVILSQTFEKFLEETDLNVEIDSILHTVNHQEVHTVENASEKIQALILEAKIPDDIASEIKKLFSELAAEFVAVRSSATAEDSSEAAWAGQLDTFLNTTEKTLLLNVQKCWASLFTPRAIFYRFEKGLHNQHISVAVVVQKMVQSEVSGIAFSVHPVTEDHNQLIIEAGFGLGEAIVSGQITPDSYVVEKEPRNITDKNISEQEKMITKAVGGGDNWQGVPNEKKSQQKLTDEEILELSELILKIEKHYGFPCDIEWAREGCNFYVTQSRPITTLSSNISVSSLSSDEEENRGVEKRYILGNQDIDTNFLNLEMTWRGMRDKRLKDQVGMLTPDSFEEVIEGRTINTYVDVLTTKEFVKSCANALIENKDLLSNLPPNTIDSTQAIRDLGETYIKQIDALSHPELAGLVDRISVLQSECVAFGTGVAFADAFGDISNKLIEILQKRQNLKYSLSVYTTNLGGSVRKNLTELAYEEIRSDKNIPKQKLLDKYFWLDQGYIGQGLSSFELQNIEDSSNITDEFIDRDLLLEELKLSQEEAYMFEVAGTLVMVKSLRADSRQYLHVLINKIVGRLAIELNLPPKYLETLYSSELSAILRKERFIPNDLEKRFIHSVYIPKEDGTYEVIVGEKVKEFLSKKLYKEEISNKESVEGQVAYSGKVSGTVRLVFGPQHNNKVKEGDILISTATSPQLLPAMKRASGFVTDVGGVTSHAAIVARELKKPCIVGTRHATQIFNDGDMVEVDAEKGVVKILKNDK